MKKEMEVICTNHSYCKHNICPHKVKHFTTVGGCSVIAPCHKWDVAKSFTGEFSEKIIGVRCV